MKKIRRFKFIGTEKQAQDYVLDPQNAPVYGKIYDGGRVFGSHYTVEKFASSSSFYDLHLEWEEVFEEKETKNAL